MACHDRISEAKQYHTEELLKRKGIPYIHFANPVPRTEQDRLLLRMRRHLALKREIHGLLDSVLPGVLVLGLDNDPIAQIAIGWTKRHSAASVLVPEGLLKPKEFTREKKYFSEYVNDGLRRLGLNVGYSRYGSGGCDRVLVTGIRAFDILSRVGVPEERMVIVGMQKYDSFLRGIEESDLKYSGNKTLLYAASTRIFDSDQEVELVRRIADAAGELGLRVIVKLHPRSVRGPQDFHTLLGSRYGSWVEVTKEGYETLEILKRVDSVVTISSAIVLEALMLNKECLVADYLAGRRGFGYKGYDAVHIIQKEEEVAGAVRESVFHRKPYEKKKRLLEDELYRLDGKAGERSARIIEDLALQRTS